MQIGRLNWTWPTYSLSVNNTDWTNLWVLTLAALGGGLVGAGAASLKPSDFDIFNIFKPQGPSGTQGKKNPAPSDILPHSHCFRFTHILVYKGCMNLMD